MLAERARSWLSGEAARPNEQETRRLLRQQLEQCYGTQLKRLLLTGSRARGTQHVNSDWDIVAIVEGARHRPEGPFIRSFPGPDGKPVELVTIPPEDFEHPARYFVEMRGNHV